MNNSTTSIKAILITACVSAALTATLFLCLNETHTHVVAAQSPSSTTYAPPAQQGARYQIFFSPMARADTFLVDTQAGTVWQMQSKEGGGIVFERLSVSGSQGQSSAQGTESPDIAPSTPARPPTAP